MVLQDGSFFTKVVGVTFKNDDGSDRQSIIRNLVRNGELDEGAEVFFVPQPANPHDSNCILVKAGNGQTLGCLSREMAAKVAPQIRQGYTFKAYVTSLTGGDIGYAYGINLRIERYKKQETTQIFAKSKSEERIQSTSSSNSFFSDNAKVQQLYQRALNGDVVAQHNMGGCYMEGVGVNKDPSKAAYWFRKAAENGFVDAQDNLGLMYLKGEGVEQNDEEAISWFLLAASSNSADAQNNIGCCYMSGVGVDINPSNALTWWRMAADQGHPAALYNLGRAYIEGEIVEENAKLGFDYMLRSAEKGHQPAIEFIKSL